MVESLPPRQREVLRLIVTLTAKQGYPPTLAELAEGMGLRNRMTVHQHVAALKKKGMVSWEPGLNRSLRVIGTAQQELHPVPPDNENHSGLPLIGTIAAGQPIDAFETGEQLAIETQYGESGCFALKIKGDSMIEDGIFDGDYVIIKPNPSPKNGDIVVALLEDGSATLKHFYKEKGRYRLQPANQEMEPIYIDANSNLEIQGTVVGLFRKFH